MRPALLDGEGTSTGALAVLFDWVIGLAVPSPPPGMLMTTTHLHIEMLRPAPRHPLTLRGEAHCRQLTDAAALGMGTITDSVGDECARATMGAFLVERPPDEVAPLLQPSIALQHAQDEPQLNGETVEIGQLALSMRFRAGAETANAAGGVHGGFGVLMAQRALHAAVDRVKRPGQGLFELHAAFVRPIAADGASIDCEVRVLHSGRRLTVARAELQDQAGRAAVLVDATYMAGFGVPVE